MQSKWIALIGFLAVLLLLVASAVSRAAGGVYDAYLPVVVHGGPWWQEVGAGSASGGGISNTPVESSDPSIAIAPDGTPYVAWQDGGGEAQIYVKRWNGQTWEEVGSGSASGGGISNTNGLSQRPSIAIAPDGKPYVTWDYFNPYEGSTEIYVRMWDGQDWVEVGEGSASGGGISNTFSESSFSPVIAIAPDGTPYVAWSDYSDSGYGYQIYVRAWNGSSWGEVGNGSASGGGISNTTDYSTNPSIAISLDGTPYVVWEEGQYRIYVRYWDGNTWAEVGAGSASGGGVNNEILMSRDPTIAVAPDGTPYVGWGVSYYSPYPMESFSQIYVRAWDGATWAEVGTGSASGGGISNNLGTSILPSIAISQDGTPFVSWSDSTGGALDIFVRSWSGNAWEEVGAGSASGGGISRTYSSVSNSSITIAPDGTPYVVWEASAYSEIYIRRYIE